MEHVWEADTNYFGYTKMRDLMALRSESEWLLPLDDKDLLDPDHVEIGSRHLDEADIIYSWCRVKKLDGEDSDFSTNRLFNPHALIRNNYIPITALIKKDLLMELGGFEHNNHWSLWLRALKAGARFKCVPEVTWTMRLEEPSLRNQVLGREAIQKPYELDRLIEFIQGRPKPKVVLEIGTAKGGTLWLWCQLSDPNAFIISVDLPGGPFGGGYEAEQVPQILNYTTHHQKMQLFRGDSHNPEMLKSVERVLTKRKVDLLFIDGDHTLEGVTKDWEMYSPLVKPGGVVIFHDIIDHTEFPECQVKPLWDELKTKYPHEEFIASDGVWGGIGVLYL